ncbi:hypothetical protein IWQ62_005026 [Dispira parvispora]|uniref:Uncharacterized protein n=1 Tax=Dispira parvispora TaxID=1520584 RepID=A0A9W8AKI4_9FUNG|nr:hypothetical protein IWQ62_005026 [Dispira parvispora]
MQVGQFSPVVATTVVLLFTFVCGVIGTPPLNRHLEVAEFPPHSEASLSQPTSLVSRLKLLTDRIAAIYDRYSCALGALGEKDTRLYLCPPDVTYTFSAGFNNPGYPAELSSGSPSNHASQPLEVPSAQNNLSKKQTRKKPDARLPVEFHTRVFNKPKVDTTKFFAMTPLPEGFPGRELTTNDVQNRYVDIKNVLENLRVNTPQIQAVSKSTLTMPSMVKLSKGLIANLQFAKSRHSGFLNGKVGNGITGIRRYLSHIGVDGAITSALGTGKSILLIYCKENDFNTYYELIWEPNDTRYSAEILMTYFTRFYYYATFTSFIPGRNSKESEDILMKAFSSPVANICGQGRSDDAKIIFYTVQDMPTGPL